MNILQKRLRRETWRVIVSVAGGILLVGLPVSAQSPSASPNSPEGKIAFVSTRDGNWDIYVMNADGSDQTRLTNTLEAYDPCFSPDGSKIAFSSPGGGETAQIYVMNADGSNQTCLTNEKLGVMTPRFSPDGSKIAYSACRPGTGGGLWEIYVMASDGSNRTQLTHAPTQAVNGTEAGPAWSPDGTRISFAYDYYFGDHESYCGIGVVNVDGNSKIRLTESAQNLDGAPSWSPDGSKILFSRFSRESPNHSADLYMINADGANETRITNSLETEVGPVFNSDGTKIAFMSSPSTGDYIPGRLYEIYVMNVDGTNRTRLTNNSAMDGPSSWGPTIKNSESDLSSESSSLR